MGSMLGGGRARLVLLTSEAGWAATPGFGPYNVSKAALNTLGASLAAERFAGYQAAGSGAGGDFASDT